MDTTISLIRGTTNYFDIALADENGDRYLLQSGECLRFGVKFRAEHEGYMLVKTLTSADINNAGNAYTLRLSPADTEDLQCMRYCYDVGLQSGDDYFNVISCSNFNVLHNITKLEG